MWKEGSCDLECECARCVFITVRALEDYALVKLIARCGDAAARTGFELHVNRKHPGVFRAAIPAGQGRRGAGQQQPVGCQELAPEAKGAWGRRHQQPACHCFGRETQRTCLTKTQSVFVREKLWGKKVHVTLNGSAHFVFTTMRTLEDYALVKLIARCRAAARIGFELHVNRKHPGVFRAAIPAGQGRRGSLLRKWINNQGKRRGTNRHKDCRGICLRPQSCGQGIASASRSVPPWRTASRRSSPAV